MKKTHRKAKAVDPDRDTMRSEYDFSRAVRGATALRFREGNNVVLLDPDVSAVFPDSAAVNAALRSLAGLRKPRRSSKAARG